MKKIFALQGRASTGKSTTIGMLFEMLKNQGYHVLINKKQKKSKDFFVILSKNNSNIGVTTYGDTTFLIKNRLNYSLKFHCKILVCGCHLDGATVESVKSFKDFEHEFISKTIAIKPNDQKVANSKDARNC